MKNNDTGISLKKSGIVYIIFATLGFSLIPIMAQIGLSPDMTAGTLLFYRFFIAGIFFLLYCIVTHKKVVLEDRASFFSVILAGCIYSAQCIFFFSSFNYISSSIGEILYHCYPLFVLVLANVFLKETITKNKVLGVVLSIIGMCIVLYAPWSSAEIRGIIYVVLTAIISSIYMVYTKKYTSEIDTTVLTTYLCMICAVIYFVYAMIRGEFTVPDSFEIVLNIMILAVCSTVVGFFCFMKAILLLPVGQVSILSLLEPIFTIIIAFLFLDVKLTVMQCAGTCIVLIAIYIYERK